jgi:hypothetical protein
MHMRCTCTSCKLGGRGVRTYILLSDNDDGEDDDNNIICITINAFILYVLYYNTGQRRDYKSFMRVGARKRSYSRQIFSRNLYTASLQLYYIISTYYYFARTRTRRVNTIIIIIIIIIIIVIMYSHSIVRIYIILLS